MLGDEESDRPVLSIKGDQYLCDWGSTEGNTERNTEKIYCIDIDIKKSIKREDFPTDWIPIPNSGAKLFLRFTNIMQTAQSRRLPGSNVGSVAARVEDFSLLLKKYNTAKCSIKIGHSLQPGELRPISWESNCSYPPGLLDCSD
jgi:hypothetical protein